MSDEYPVIGYDASADDRIKCCNGHLLTEVMQDGKLRHFCRNCKAYVDIPIEVLKEKSDRRFALENLRMVAVCTAELMGLSLKIA